jgi:hypothetical protein
VNVFENIIEMEIFIFREELGVQMKYMKLGSYGFKFGLLEAV